MTTDGFADFVTVRSPRLLRTAYLLTHDWGTAEDLLQTALVKAWSAWRRLDGDPEPYVRRILVNTYSSWWQRRWRGEQATGAVPESTLDDPHASVDERDRVWRALLRLPRRQRAVVVLRYFEDLPEAEIAELLGVSPGTVKSQAAKALSTLRMDETLLPERIPASPPAERLAQIEKKIAQRRRRKLAVGAAGAVVLLLLFFAGYRIIATHRPAPQPPVTPPSPSYVNGFPEYDQGYRVVVSGTLPPGSISMDLTWKPTTNDLIFFAECESPSTSIDIEVTYSLPGFDRVTLPCAHHYVGVKPSVAVGQPATLHLTFIAFEVTYSSTGQRTDTPIALPAQGSYRIAVGERADAATYPFPARPAELKRLPPAGCLDLASDPADPSRPRSVELDWYHIVRLEAYLQTPGQLDLSVNGAHVDTLSWWDYERTAVLRTWNTTDGTWGNVPGLGITTADNPTRVTLTATPGRVSGGWMVMITYLDEQGRSTISVTC
jgi:RNA polymerase sigma-70 factor (sigma-E family)